jgi:cytochrome c oxidase subunit 4
MTAVAEHSTDAPAVHHDDHEQHHPTLVTYIKVGAVLAVLTALEVSTYWWPDDLRKVTAALLILMMVVKFGTVAAYFMHLKFDSKVLRRVFVAGLVLAVGVYIAALSAFVFWKHSGTEAFNDPPRHRPVPPPPTQPPVKTTVASH